MVVVFVVVVVVEVVELIKLPIIMRLRLKKEELNKLIEEEFVMKIRGMKPMNGMQSVDDVGKGQIVLVGAVDVVLHSIY